MPATVQITDLVYQPITGGRAAVHDRILDAAAARIALLALDGIQEVVAEKVPRAERRTLPAAVLTVFRQATTPSRGDFAAGVSSYPVRLQLLSRDPAEEANRGRLLLWRQQVYRSFDGQRLPAVPEVTTCEVSPDVIADTDPAHYQSQESAWVLNFWAREPRGFGL